METKQITNITITDQKVAAQYLQLLRDQKECGDDKILRKLAVIDKKLEGLGAIVVRLFAIEEKLDALAAMKVTQEQLDHLYEEIKGNKEALDKTLESPA